MLFISKSFQQKGNIERRIAIVNHFPIDHPKLTPIHKKVLRTPVAVHKTGRGAPSGQNLRSRHGYIRTHPGNGSR